MSETALPVSGPAVPPDAVPELRGRIGVARAGGFYPAPHRYQVYLCPGCPDSLRVAVTLDLLDLRRTVAVTLLTASAGARDDLRPAYEATVHHYDGPLTVPALRDRWTGRIVSNHTPDILDDLACHLRDGTRDDLPDLRPAALAADIDALRTLLDEAAAAADADRPSGPASLLLALDVFEQRLDSSPYVLGERPTAADVDLWAALVRLDAVHRLHRDPDAADVLTRYGRLRTYVRRLGRHPAFRAALPEDRPAQIQAQVRARGGREPESPYCVPLPVPLRGGAA